VLSHLLAGASAQDAVSAPRWTVGAWDRGEPVDQINPESDVDDRVRAEIENWPGPVNWLPARSGEAGHTQAIRVTPSNAEDSGAYTHQNVPRCKFDVGTDPRADAGTP
jgi:gamma-glutamyltranspeptidase/glutathione hydrolase